MPPTPKLICCSPTEVLVNEASNIFRQHSIDMAGTTVPFTFGAHKKQFFCPVLPVTFASHKNSACGRHSRCEAGSETSRSAVAERTPLKLPRVSSFQSLWQQLSRRAPPHSEGGVGGFLVFLSMLFRLRQEFMNS